MKFRPITVDNTLQELTQHGTAEFPMSMDEQRLAEVGCRAIRHWHYEVQIALMTQGSARFETPAGNCVLHAGEGVFLNSGVLHEAIPVDGEDGVYICVNFKPDFLYSSAGDLIARDYVTPVLENPELQMVPLRTEPWQKDILVLLRDMAKVNEERQYGFELELKILLCRIWHTLLIHNRCGTEKTADISFAERQRIQQLKQFIHQHYMEHILLEHIAQAGHVSRGECCRVFRRSDQISPMQYLRNYRISQSVKLLACTDLSITEIAAQTGFESSSYFTACFKKGMQCTPFEYRAAHTATTPLHP